MCGKNGCLNRTGDKPLRSIGKAATSVLPPLTTLSFSSKMNMPLTQVALVARPCAPAAQRAEDSSSSRSRLAKRYGRFAPLNLRQDCFFRVYFPKCQSSYSPPAADKLISSTHPFTEKLRSDSFQKPGACAAVKKSFQKVLIYIQNIKSSLFFCLLFVRPQLRILSSAHKMRSIQRARGKINKNV